MRNVLTRKEVAEQFGNLLLEFDFYCGSTFVFSGHDKLGNCVTIYIKGASMSFVGSKSSTTVREALQSVGEDLSFFIVDKELQILYED